MRDARKDAIEMAARRERLLEAGFRLMSARTIEAVTLQQIASDGTALVLTPPLVNTTGFDFSLLATDDLAGANPATFPLDPSGTNAVPASSSSTRFFRLKAAER